MKKSAILTIIVGFCLTHWSFTTKTTALGCLLLTSTHIKAQSRNLTLDDTIMFKPARYIPNMQTFGFNIGFDNSGIFYPAARPDYRFDIDVLPILTSVALSDDYRDLNYAPDINNIPFYYHKYESDTLHKLAISGQSLSINTGTLVVNTVVLPSNTLTSISAGTGISLTSGTLITNTLPDQTVSFVAGNNDMTITGTYPNFTITPYVQTTYSVTRSINSTTFQVSSTRYASVVYNIGISCTASIGSNATGSVLLQYSLNNGSIWLNASELKNSNIVTLAIALQSVNNQEAVLSMNNIPAGAILRLVPTTAGTTTITYIQGFETY